MDTSANGWTNNEIALKWLSEVFILNTKPTDPDQWRMLILKGHTAVIPPRSSCKRA